MKTPAVGKQMKVTAQTLAGLGAERLAEILVAVAETRADLKRRLRMELAAEQGPAALAAAIDKRLGSFETSRGKIPWRQRNAFMGELEGLGELIAARLAPNDAGAARDRLWRLMDTARQTGSRYRERADELDDFYVLTAGNLGRLLPLEDPGASLIASLASNPAGWKKWLPALLEHAPRTVAENAIAILAERSLASPAWIPLIRQLADAAGDIEAFRATFPSKAQQTPAAATEIGARLLRAGRIGEAGETLRAAASNLDPKLRHRIDFDWETVWIDYLEADGRGKEAQAVRWASFERTLATERARAFVARLADFDDVEAEARAFQIAREAEDVNAGLEFLMSWPSLVEASRMIEQRSEEITAPATSAEAWAAKLRGRFPRAAQRLLRRAAAAAFRRRDFKTSDRLTAEAETILV